MKKVNKSHEIIAIPDGFTHQYGYSYRFQCMHCYKTSSVYYSDFDSTEDARSELEDKYCRTVDDFSEEISSIEATEKRMQRSENNIYIHPNKFENIFGRYIGKKRKTRAI